MIKHDQVTYGIVLTLNKSELPGKCQSFIYSPTDALVSCL